MQERVAEFKLDDDLRRTRTPVLNAGEPEAKREEIRRYFHQTFDLDEALLETVAYDESFCRRADPLRHPLIFYFGHTATFFINKLIIAKLISTRINPSFESMFAVGVDEMSWDDLNNSHYEWASVAEVQAYRDEVRTVVDELISSLPLALPITWDSPFWVIMMGIEHARIHIETSSVLIRQLPLDQVRAHPLFEACRRAGEAPRNRLIDVAGGAVELGKQKTHALYGWDNEFGSHAAAVEPFGASRYLVSNGEFLEFVSDGGYADATWWTEEGAAWRAYAEAEHPHFWRVEAGHYRLRLVLETIEMPWDWPVEVNQLEAKAFCNWKGARAGKSIRLPSEEEWTLLRDRFIDTDQPYWESAPGNINLEHYASPCPVTEFAFGEFGDLIGNVWQWTETPINGFRGFHAHPCYDDFSAPTFDTRHNLIKGGSWISTGNEATRDARYAFRRHFFQHAGFRYVEAEHGVPVIEDAYESDEMLCQYCEFHYGESLFEVPNYPRALAEICIALSEGKARGKALDLGCAVGRASFELAQAFEHVTGLDFSANFIRKGVELKQRGYLRYMRQDEGELATIQERSLAELGLAERADRVEFFQADACNLKELYTGYDLILAANLIDRLYNPRRFLSTIHERLNAGGVLVLSSPYTWMTDYTKRDEWIGGFRKDGEAHTTLAALHELLTPHFKPIGEPVDVPFVIRETQRKHQHTIAQLTAWERR